MLIPSGKRDATNNDTSDNDFGQKFIGVAPGGSLEVSKNKIHEKVFKKNLGNRQIKMNNRSHRTKTYLIYHIVFESFLLTLLGILQCLQH